MLNSLEIRNYRNLRHLTIEKLGRVNLLVGKNNTGKTSVLEAISLLACKANLQWISKIFEERGEDASSTSLMETEQRIEYNLELLSGLFYGREYSTDKQASILISSEDGFLTLRFVYYIKEEIQDEEGTYSRIVTVNSPNNSEGLGLEITVDNTFQVVTLNRNLNRPTRFRSIPENIQFVRSSGINRETNGRLWDKITSSEKNIYVEDALRLIEPNIESLRFVLPNIESYGTKRKDERIGRVQLKGLSKPIYLRSMGDGINRILTIILAMVNCENGYLFIDEFENGLHYSVQEKLWEIIFFLSERLNIQVFATTHSNDAVKWFTYILAKQEKPDEAGKAIRLQLHNGDVRAIDYSPEELETAVEYNIEVR
ncbi:AAA family ATPase [Spirosoma aerolatum]|uniref:AAA family ATPase n=1 Tax=Spirosoma aerolatum TaxID=1211326 RepID=UPI0009AD1111|nr:ATP-binding protein [Spirosoma aerolatum]